VGDVDRFLERHWDRAPLLRAPGEMFDDLASLDDLDRMIASSGLHSSSLRMVQDGKTLSTGAYTRAPGKTSKGIERLVEPAAVVAAYAGGATIVLESLHRYWPPLARFCRDLELALGHRLQVNAYITPPSSRGFDVHKDAHDVFVLQVSGGKHWIVYDRDEPQHVLIDEEMTPGAALYIPTGFPHAATTGRGASAHLTVGILTHDGRDVVRETLKLAEDEPTFRQRLPVGLDEDGLRDVVEGQLTELRVWLDKIDVDEVTHRVARKVMTTAQPILGGQLGQLALLDRIRPDTQVIRRAGATCALFPAATKIIVLLADRELEMPVSARGAMETIARRTSFTIGELHDHLTPQSALILVRRLVREGLLEVVVDD